MARLQMDELCLIGIGTGNPDHLTAAGAEAIRQADVILIPRKGSEKSDLADLRLEICQAVLEGQAADIIEFELPVRDDQGDYLEGVDAWHDAISEAWVGALPKGARAVALLVWGDPSLYDSTLRIAERLSPKPKLRVIPGITSLQALTAAHAIPLNEIGQPVCITTGRKLAEGGWPEGVTTIAVMLDGKCSFQTVPPNGVTIWWGAFLGMKNEVLITGKLTEVSDLIVETRAHARAEHGWIMDTYILRRVA